MEEKAKIDNDGSIEIPIALLNKLRLKKQDKVILKVKDDTIILRKK